MKSAAMESMVKYGKVEQFGMPLMEKLRNAKAPVDPKLFASTMKSAAMEASGAGGGQQQQQPGSAENANQFFGGYDTSYGGEGKGKSGSGGTGFSKGSFPGSSKGDSKGKGG